MVESIYIFCKDAFYAEMRVYYAFVCLFPVQVYVLICTNLGRLWTRKSKPEKGTNLINYAATTTCLQRF